MPIRSPTISNLEQKGFPSNANPYVEKVLTAISQQSLPIYSGERLQKLKGKWQAQFSSQMTEPPQQLILEIGSYKGKTCIEWAAQHPDKAFIGMDITFKRIFLSAQRSTAANLANLNWTLANASCLEQIFADDEIDGTAVFFPDPWQKKAKHKKNQLISLTFLNALSKVMKNKGFLWLKTDSEAYWHNAQEIAQSSNFTLFSEQAPTSLSSPQATVFENLFLRQKLPIFQGVWYNEKNQ